MHTAWSDDVYPLRPEGSWLARLVWCWWLQWHWMREPQVPRPGDPTLSYGPCGRCGGVHYWRQGRWRATHLNTYATKRPSPGRKTC